MKRYFFVSFQIGAIAGNATFPLSVSEPTDFINQKQLVQYIREKANLSPSQKVIVTNYIEMTENEYTQWNA